MPLKHTIAIDMTDLEFLVCALDGATYHMDQGLKFTAKQKRHWHKHLARLKRLVDPTKSQMHAGVASTIRSIEVRFKEYK